MKFIKTISLFLGISLFMFGILKFFNPFKGWYSIQITNSGLGEISYVMGILGELSVGIAFLSIFIFQSKISHKQLLPTVIFASTVVIIMMLTGIYVHLHPNVPAEVLPLKIKPPYIPVFFLLIALSNIYLSINRKKGKTDKK